MLKKVTVVGAGVSGQALAFFAERLGAQVFVSDKKENLSPEICSKFDQASIQYEFGGHTTKCCECDLMILSSGIGPQSEAVSLARRNGVRVAGELDFLSPYLKGKLIAITGTNGKTTTTSLIGHLLKSNGLNAAVAGNIGFPLADCALKPYDAIVMELSSFQLYWNHVLTPDVAVLTNLAPDHIDWHGSYENYRKSKIQVFGHPSSKCWAIVQSSDVEFVPSGGRICTLGGNRLPNIEICSDKVQLCRKDGIQSLFSMSELKLVGIHNIENAAMATASVALAFPGLKPSCGLPDFLAPPHRCQLVGNWNGVTYIDDSKGTNVAASVTALNGIEGLKIVILGGQGKGEEYGLLAEVVKRKAKAAVVLGSEAKKIILALHKSGFQQIYRVKDMDEAVRKSIELAVPGDTVLLSPACTSWDMYHSFNERGDHFTLLVRKYLD